MNMNELLLEYLTSNKLMQLATVAEGKPWLCNVYFVADADNNIYWTSAKRRRHSIEIHNNQDVAATIVHSQDNKQALQITGLAHEVDQAEVEKVHSLYGAKFGQKDSRLQEVRENYPDGDGRAYWVLKPTSIFFWDEVNFSDVPKQEYPLWPSTQSYFEPAVFVK